MKKLLNDLRPRFNREWYKNEHVYSALIFAVFLFRPQGFWAVYREIWMRDLFIVALLVSLYFGFFTKIGQKETCFSLALSVALFFLILIPWFLY